MHLILMCLCFVDIWVHIASELQISLLRRGGKIGALSGASTGIPLFRKFVQMVLVYTSLEL